MKRKELEEKVKRLEDLLFRFNRIEKEVNFIDTKP
jgi:hypothetical protein